MSTPVLPSMPSATETDPSASADDVIDLRSPATETGVGDGPSWTAGGTAAIEIKEEDLSSLLGYDSNSSDSTVTTGTQVDEEIPTVTQTSSRAHTSLQSTSVADLVQKARSGDGGAWEELVARFGGMIAATGRRYRLSAADVAELQQTTWLRLVENLHRIEQPERVGGWLATTARRESLQLLKRAAKYHSGADQMLANLPDRHLPEPDARPIADERDEVIRAAWDRMKPRCQELLSLLIADDPLHYKDLSLLLQMPVGSIGPTRARCLEHLRRLVEEEGMTGI
jgi:RNA polymerase sigma factor (sigma-70 family)